MKLPLLTKEEFCLFSNDFQMAYIDRHGRLIYFKILDEEMSISIYEFGEIKVRVLTTFPVGLLIKITLINNSSKQTKYLSLVYQN
ncbi:MAG: hypothetical protein ACI857_002073 [Arenicella sp.]|jgi:hypothetical protein